MKVVFYAHPSFPDYDRIQWVPIATFENQESVPREREDVWINEKKYRVAFVFWRYVTPTSQDYRTPAQDGRLEEVRVYLNG